MLLERGVDPRTVDRPFYLPQGSLELSRGGYFFIIDRFMVLSCAAERGTQLALLAPWGTPACFESRLNSAYYGRFVEPPQLNWHTIQRQLFKMNLGGGGKSRVYAAKYQIDLLEKDEGRMLIDIASPKTILVYGHPDFRDAEAELKALQ